MWPDICGDPLPFVSHAGQDKGRPVPAQYPVKLTPHGFGKACPESTESTGVGWWVQAGEGADDLMEACPCRRAHSAAGLSEPPCSSATT